ncbi:Uncharacterised protein [Vibrio cholerae]|nr:Uncharacterised protein [Vibrio cholerae]
MTSGKASTAVSIGSNSGSRTSATAFSSRWACSTKALSCSSVTIRSYG